MRLTALTLESVTESATDAVEFAFLPKRPLPFRPGQAGLVIVPGGGAKPFTFACDNRAGRISIATTLHSGTRFKRALADLRAGDRVHAVERSAPCRPPIRPSPRYSSRRAPASPRSWRLPGRTAA